VTFAGFFSGKVGGFVDVFDTSGNLVKHFASMGELNLPWGLTLAPDDFGKEGGGRLEFAYFPNRGLISLVVAMKDGRTAEAGIVGNEGFTGTPAAVGLSRSPLQAVVQITGDGFRVETAALQTTLESTPTFNRC